MAVYKRGKLWYARGQVKGERYNQSLADDAPRTKEDAKALDAQIRAKIRQGVYDIERDKTLFSEFVNKTYLPHSEKLNPSFKQKICETNKLKEFFGSYQLRRITPALVETYKSKRSAEKKKCRMCQTGKADCWRCRGKKQCAACVRKAENHVCQSDTIAPSTVNRELTTLSAIFSYAIFPHRKLKENPAALVPKLEEPDARDRYLSADEKVALLREVKKNPQLEQIVILGLMTGWRKGQILGVTKEGLNAKLQVVFRGKSKRNPSGWMPVNRTAWAIFEQLAEQVESGHLFRHKLTNEPLKDFVKTWRNALSRAGVKDFRFHDLRHTFATELLSTGAEGETIQTALGHSDIKTSRLYMHVTDKLLRENLERLEENTDRKLRLVG